MKKSEYLIFGFLFLFLSRVSAAAYSSLGTGLGYGVEQLVYIGQSILSPILYIIFGYGNLMLERVLFLVVVFCVVYVVISNLEPFKNKSSIIWIVSIAVSLLATRYLTEVDLVKTVLLPYSAFGIGLTCAIPLLLYYKFTMGFTDQPTARKILWIFFIVVFLGLWSSRAEDVGEFSWIYLATAIIAFFFLLFDGTIQKWINDREKALRGGMAHADYIASLNKKLKDHRDEKLNWQDIRAWERKEKELLKDIRKESKKKAWRYGG